MMKSPAVRYEEVTGPPPLKRSVSGLEPLEPEAPVHNFVGNPNSFGLALREFDPHQLQYGKEFLKKRFVHTLPILYEKRQFWLQTPPMELAFEPSKYDSGSYGITLKFDEFDNETASFRMLLEKLDRINRKVLMATDKRAGEDYMDILSDRKSADGTVYPARLDFTVWAGASIFKKGKQGALEKVNIDGLERGTRGKFLLELTGINKSKHSVKASFRMVQGLIVGAGPERMMIV